MLNPFDYQPRTRVVFGAGALARLGELAHEHGARRVLLVTDGGIVAAGHVGRAVRFLEDAGCKVVIFEGVHENPTTRDVDACLQTARAAEIDFFVGLGGGSSMDTAKGCNFLLTNGGQMGDYRGVGKAHSPKLPLIAVPTPPGTGSECQSFALIAEETTHAKMACGDPKAAARVALLDPELTLTQPRAVAACTGLDALSHAVESAVTKKRNEASLIFSHEAFRLLEANLQRVLEEPNDIEARGAMQLGAAWAGTAIENSMLGAAHAAANPLSAHFNVVHGHAVGVMLPHVIRFNAQNDVANAEYERLYVSAEKLALRVDELLGVCNAPRTLRDCNVKPNCIPELAREAAAQWTATFNPRAISAKDFEQLYEAAF
jgi:alcohol dehydrogenase